MSNTRSAPNSVLQAVGHAEHPAGAADVLTEDQHPRVVAERVAQRRVERAPTIVISVTDHLAALASQAAGGSA